MNLYMVLKHEYKKTRIHNSIHLHLWYNFEQLTKKKHFTQKSKQHTTTDNTKHFTHLFKKKIIKSLSREERE